MSDMKSIQEWNKLGIGGLIRMYLHEAWYFEKAWEKLILIGLSFLGLVRIVQWVM